MISSAATARTRNARTHAPLLPVALCIMVAIAVLFPPGAYEPQLPLVSEAAGNMQQWRARLLGSYREAGLSDQAYAIVAAMTLGDKSAIDPKVRHTYNATGASHILALSGLHLGIIYMLLTIVVPMRRWRMLSQTITILAIWTFALLTGLSPSILRAATMLTVYGLLSIGYREKSSVNALALAAILLLLASPQSLYNVGFQMSFTAVLAILLFMPLFELWVPAHWLQRHGALRMLWSLTAVSLAAQIGTAPLIAYYFHRFSTCALLSNFVVVPCAYLIIAGGLLLLVTQASVVAWALTAVVNGMTRSLDWLASLPGSSIGDVRLNLPQLALIYIVIACFYGFFCTFAGRNKYFQRKGR